MGKNRNNNDTKTDEKESQMEFTLFGRKTFKINNPLTLIEAYCIQNDFYRNYDLLEKKTIKDANRIGARGVPKKAENVVNRYSKLKLLQLNIDELLKTSDDVKNKYIGDFSEAIAELITPNVKGIGLAKATKIYHTLYPEIIPMIDSLLLGEYMSVKDITKDNLSLNELFIDYYKTFYANRENIDKLYGQLFSQRLRLTKVRIFDIIWWSFLKYKKLNADLKKLNTDFEGIQLSTIIESK